MSQNRTLDHLGSALQGLSRHWGSLRGSISGPNEAPSGQRSTIALAREAGTEGTAVAQEVGRRLGWPVYDHELLDRIAQDRGWRTRLLESVDERHLSWLLEAFQAFAGVASVSESAYVHELVKTMLALSIHGECVIVGRGAAHRLPVETTFRVRLVAPVKHRTDRLARNQGLSAKEAARRVAKLDSEHTRFVKEHFFKDPNDPRNYDLVVNVSRLSVSACANIVVQGLSALQACAIDQTCSS